MLAANRLYVRYYGIRSSRRSSFSRTNSGLVSGVADRVTVFFPPIAEQVEKSIKILRISLNWKGNTISYAGYLDKIIKEPRHYIVYEKYTK